MSTNVERPIKDIEWAIKHLNDFINASANTPSVDSGFNTMIKKYQDYDSRMAEYAPIIEPILDRATPGWRVTVQSSLTSRWDRLREAAIRARTVLTHNEEMRQNLGDNAPELSASEFHPWIWEGAQSLWNSGHYREAVESAIRKLNAETQNKIGRRDISETNLFKQAFSTEAPMPDQPRLCRMENDGSKTYKSVQRGAMSFAEGIFAGIRNPLAHEADQDLSEQQALEYLAALSVLARWVDDSKLETAQ